MDVDLNLSFASDNEVNASGGTETCAFYDRSTGTKLFTVHLFASGAIRLETSNSRKLIATVAEGVIEFFRLEALPGFEWRIDDRFPTTNHINIRQKAEDIECALQQSPFKLNNMEYHQPPPRFPGGSRIICFGNELYYWKRENHKIMVSNFIFGCGGNNLTEPLQLLLEGQSTNLATIDKSGADRFLTVTASAMEKGFLDDCLVFAILYFRGQVTIE